MPTVERRIQKKNAENGQTMVTVPAVNTTNINATQWTVKERHIFMHKRIFPVLTAILLAVVSVAVAEKNMGAADIVIPATKGNVAFPHKTHQTAVEDCNTCHHLFPQSPGSIGKLKESGDLRRMQVMKQCLTCHRELTDAGKKAGPVSCNDCHQ